MAKILIIAGYGRSLISFRGDLIKELLARGHEVIAVAPESDCAEEVRALGCGYHSFSMKRSGMNPFVDMGSIRALVSLLNICKPDILFSYTIKPVIYGSIAARIAGISQVYSMISGLGYAFGAATVKQKIIGGLVRFLYKQALQNNRKVFFQNPDDISVFQSLNLLPKGRTAVLVNGSGVNIERFGFNPAKTTPVTFLLMARLIWDKGIGQLVEAGRKLKKNHPDIRIVLLGAFDTNPNAITRECIAQWEQEGIIEYLGETRDVRPYLRDSSVYVLPSYYPEGTPRSILEALSVGRPIITTNTPGCRETVREGINGYLVTPKDSDALATAMKRFIVDPSLIKEMGEKSRQLAEEKYDVRKVNQAMLRAMGLDEVV